MRNSIDPRKLVLTSTFDFTTPEDYNHSSQLLTFKQKHENEFYWFDKLMNDKDCGNASQKLIANKKYTARIFLPGIDANMQAFLDCIDYLKDTGYFYANAQGLSLMYQIAKDFFPVDVHLFSPDKLEALPVDTHHDIPQTPRIRILKNGQAEFHPYSARTSLRNNGHMYLLAFTQRKD